MKLNQQREHDADRHRRAMRGETPCPLCGVTIHPQIKCGDGKIVDYCAPTNAFGHIASDADDDEPDYGWGTYGEYETDAERNL